MTKEATKIPPIILENDIFLIDESWGNFNLPNKYSANPVKIKIQRSKNGSIFKRFQCATKSAFDKNLNAKANSKNPKITLVVLSQPPDFGSALIILGNKANKAKGNPREIPKPAIPAVNCQAPPSAVSDPAKSDPKIGPVHENDTIASVSAIKNIPMKPPELSPCVVVFVQLDGSVNS